MSGRFHNIYERFQKKKMDAKIIILEHARNSTENYNFLPIKFSNFCSIPDKFQDDFFSLPPYFFLESFMYIEPNGHQFICMRFFSKAVWLSCFMKNGVIFE